MSKRFTKVTISGNQIKDSLIEKTLYDNGIDWILECEFENADITIVNRTIIWNGGEFYTGDWHYGIFRSGIFHGVFVNGIFDGGVFKGTWISGVDNTKKSGDHENPSSLKIPRRNSTDTVKGGTSLRTRDYHHHRPTGGSGTPDSHKNTK